MNTYRMAMRAWVTFTIEADSDDEAMKKARTLLNNTTDITDPTNALYVGSFLTAIIDHEAEPVIEEVELGT